MDQPDYGRRLIPTLIDENAFSKPHEAYCHLPRTSSIEDGFQPIDFQTFANAINACAWWLEDEVGKCETYSTLAYLGPSDLRNIILIVAAVKTGHQALLASPRNSLTAHNSLFESTNCQVLLTPKSVPPLAREVLAHKSMKHIIIPELQYWLEHPPIAPFSYDRSFHQARYEPFVVIHTSGSTGLPKVVVVNHGTFAATDAFNRVLPDLGSAPMAMDKLRNKHCFVSAPTFHIAGIDWMLAKPFYHGIIPVLGPAGQPMTAELVDEMHQLDMVEISVVAPSLLQELSLSPVAMENIRKLIAVIYGGGPLPPKSGDAIAARTKLHNFLGSSETGNVPTEDIDSQDWEYLKFSPKLGYEMRHYSSDLFELCFTRKDHLDLYQSVFSTFPDRQDYFSSDLYSKHPTKPDLWKYRGRADDILTLTNGEKVNPVAMEDLISTHPAVRSVLVVGQARFQTALLVEARDPPACSASKNEIIEDIWSTIQQANEQCDMHAKIARDLVLVADADRPFQRAGKGTVQRRATVDLYAKEIDELYDVFERLTQLSPPDSAVEMESSRRQSKALDTSIANGQSVEEWLQGLICTITGFSHVDTTTNLFSFGMDSLHVINLVRKINAAVPASKIPLTRVTSKVVYTNPTIASLATACKVTLQKRNSDLQDDHRTENIEDEIRKMIMDYPFNLPITCRPPVSVPSSDCMYVLLTGSTGSLGSHIFASLLYCPGVAHIYCLNRSKDADRRQRESCRNRGINAEWSSERVSFFQSDLSEQYLGLEKNAYRSLLSNVTHVVHNAWEVNFNLPLTSFEVPHLLGVRQYIDFSSRSAKGASILFVSSVSASMNWPLKHSGPVPEHLIDDPLVSLPLGYAQSKYISEQVLGRAAEIAGIPSMICRVGQVCGSTSAQDKSSSWNKQEWLPSLIASSKYLGKIPGSLGPNETIDWIPVDVLGRVLVELLEAQSIKALKDACPIRESHSINGPKTQARNDVTQGSETGGRAESELIEYQEPEMLEKEDHQVITNISIFQEARTSTSQGDDYSDSSGSVKVYHAVNPSRTTWSSLLPTVKAHFDSIPLETVSLTEWVEALSKSVVMTEDIDINPSIRLLDFYGSLLDESKSDSPTFETSYTVSQSKELARLEAVKPEWMKSWLEQWDF